MQEQPTRDARKLILVKHAAPEVVPGVPPEQWKLSEKGRALCTPLAEHLGRFAPSVIFSSEEPKASETAELIADRLKIAWRTAPGLHEHDRSNVPHMRSADFISMMELLFRRPDDPVLGRETAAQARARFKAAVQRAVTSQPSGNVAIVSHGTVIALLAAGERSRFQTWREMGLPSFAVLGLPDMRVEQFFDRIA